MTISLVLFVISFAFIVALLSLKYWESKSRQILCANIRNRADEYTRRVCERMATDTRKKVHAGFHTSLHTVLHAVHVSLTYVRDALEKRLIRVLNFIRGRGVSTRTGSASFFLRRIAHHKEQMQNGHMDN